MIEVQASEVTVEDTTEPAKVEQTPKPKESRLKWGLGDDLVQFRELNLFELRMLTDMRLRAQSRLHYNDELQEVLDKLTPQEQVILGVYGAEIPQSGLHPLLMTKTPMVLYYEPRQSSEAPGGFGFRRTTVCLLITLDAVPSFFIGTANRNKEAGDVASDVGRKLAFHRALTESPAFSTANLPIFTYLA